MWEMLIQKMMQQLVEQSTRRMDPKIANKLKSLDGDFTVDLNKNGIPDFIEGEMDDNLLNLAQGLSDENKQELGKRLDLAFSRNKQNSGSKIPRSVLGTSVPKGLVGEKDIWDYLRVFLLIDVLIAFGAYVYFYLM